MLPSRRAIPSPSCALTCLGSVNKHATELVDRHRNYRTVCYTQPSIIIFTNTLGLESSAIVNAYQHRPRHNFAGCRMDTTFTTMPNRSQQCRTRSSDVQTSMRISLQFASSRLTMPRAPNFQRWGMSTSQQILFVPPTPLDRLVWQTC